MCLDWGRPHLPSAPSSPHLDFVSVCWWVGHQEGWGLEAPPLPDSKAGPTCIHTVSILLPVESCPCPLDGNPLSLMGRKRGVGSSLSHASIYHVACSVQPPDSSSAHTRTNICGGPAGRPGGCVGSLGVTTLSRPRPGRNFQPWFLGTGKNWDFIPELSARVKRSNHGIQTFAPDP